MINNYFNKIIILDKEIKSCKINKEEEVAEFKKLGDLADIFMGAILARLAYERKTVPMKAKILMPRAINNGLIDKEFVSDTRIKDSTKDKYFAKEGDLVIQATSPYETCYTDEEYLVPSFCARIIPKDKNLSYYILSFLNSETFYGAIKQELPVGKFLTVERIKNLLVPIYSEETMAQIGEMYHKILQRRQLMEQLKKEEDKTFSKIFKY